MDRHAPSRLPVGTGAGLCVWPIAFKVFAWTCVAAVPMTSVFGGTFLGQLVLAIVPSFLGARAMVRCGAPAMTARIVASIAMAVGSWIPGLVTRLVVDVEGPTPKGMLLVSAVALGVVIDLALGGIGAELGIRASRDDERGRRAT